MMSTKKPGSKPIKKARTTVTFEVNKSPEPDPPPVSDDLTGEHGEAVDPGRDFTLSH